MIRFLDDSGLTVTYLSEPITIPNFNIKKVIFNYPATIVLWEDGTKTVVKCTKDEPYDPEKGLALCVAKRALGDKYKRAFKTWKDPEMLKQELLSIRLDTNSKAMDRLMGAIDRGYVPDD